MWCRQGMQPYMVASSAKCRPWILVAAFPVHRVRACFVRMPILIAGVSFQALVGYHPGG
jgi:hypothetical protein